MGPHVSALLRLGLSVVLDWPANTVTSRAWMRSVLKAGGAAHVLHVLDVADAVSLERLRARNASGLHLYTLDEAQFEVLSRYYEPPTSAEEFTVVIHSHGSADSLRGTRALTASSERSGSLPTSLATDEAVAARGRLAAPFPLQAAVLDRASIRGLAVGRPMMGSEGLRSSNLTARVHLEEDVAGIATD
jgi:hypothetical protein